MEEVTLVIRGQKCNPHKKEGKRTGLDEGSRDWGDTLWRLRKGPQAVKLEGEGGLQARRSNGMDPPLESPKERS